MYIYLQIHVKDKKEAVPNVLGIGYLSGSVYQLYSSGSSLIVSS